MKIYKIPKGTKVFEIYGTIKIYFITNIDWYVKEASIDEKRHVYKNKQNKYYDGWFYINDYLFSISDEYMDNIILYRS